MENYSITNSVDNYNSQDRRGTNYAAYDLEAEKTRIEQGRQDVLKEMCDEWNLRFANSSRFSFSMSKINPVLRNYLLNFELIYVYEEIANLSGLSKREGDALPHVIWNCALQKNFDSIEKFLEENNFNEEKIKSVKILLEQKIVSNINNLSLAQNGQDISLKNISTERNFAIMPIRDALNQFLKIYEQQISINPLRISGFSNPVRPSIRNWIADYHDVLGAKKHTSVERGGYLFQGENGKRLTPLERQKVALVLKSLDENVPLSVDAQKQLIVFSSSSMNDFEKAKDAESQGMAGRVDGSSGIGNENKSVAPMEKNDKEDVRFGSDDYYAMEKRQIKNKQLGTQTNSPNFGNMQNMKVVNKKEYVSGNRDANGQLNFSSPHTLPYEME